MRKMITIVAMAIFGAIGCTDQGITGDNGRVAGSTEKSQEGVQPAEPELGKKYAHLDGVACTEGDNTPCMAALPDAIANGNFDGACLPMSPVAWCLLDTAENWSCFAATSMGCTSSVKCTMDSQCNDKNACTTDICSAGGQCFNVGLPSNEGTTCDDASACSENDMCTGGSCAGTPLACDDQDACNGLETCDAATGCVMGTPVDCADQDLCTADSCDSATGACTHTAVVCNDQNACTQDSCDSATGNCVFNAEAMDGMDCEDGVSCTSGEKCMAGVCGGGSANNSLCDDQNFCSYEDWCDPTEGCMHSWLIEGQSCNQGTGCCTMDGGSTLMCGSCSI